MPDCRLCQSHRVNAVVDLGFHPLADTFLSGDLQFGPEVSYPLQLGLCGDCGHVFTLYSVSPQERYQKHDYSYDSSNSTVAIQHFKEFCGAVLKDYSLPQDSLIVDIGSNVGTLLRHFSEAGYTNVLGVEPSGNISKLAVESGIPTLNEFFGEKAVIRINEIGSVKILLGANVLNHADDLVSLLKTARQVLSPDGIFVFEVPYLLDLIQRTAFDTIYHEHVHYFGIKALVDCFRREGFSIYKVERLEYMCGSIRVYARIGSKTSDEVYELISREEAYGLYESSAYEAFMQRVRAVKYSVNEHLWKIRANGGKIIGIGAATKGNTFLNYCRLDSDLITYITDASPLKIGKRTPGSHIPIVADSTIDKSVSHALILPWNIADFLKAKLAHLGLEFYVPQVKTLSDSKY
jgi:SAM-dependent methyltransferase